MQRYYTQVHYPFLIILLLSFLIVGCNKKSQDQFDLSMAKTKWNSAQHQWTDNELRILELGRSLYTMNCGACHGSKGDGDNLIGAPALKNNSITKGDPTAHIKIVLNGKSKNSMPAYAQILNNKGLAAIISYERNAWGNNTFILISEAQIQIHRKQ